MNNENIYIDIHTHNLSNDEDVLTVNSILAHHITNSLNIPLHQIEARVSTLKKKKKIIITCCKSGGRSGRAKSILMKNGLKCVNGGSWGGLNYIIH